MAKKHKNKDKMRKFYDVLIPQGEGVSDAIVEKIRMFVPEAHWCLHLDCVAPFIRFWVTDNEWTTILLYLNVCGPDTVYYF